MIPTIKTFDGHNINDTTNYNAYFPAGNFYEQAGVDISEVKRSGNFPALASKVLQSKKLTVNILLRGTLANQYDQINLWFDAQDEDLKTLVIEDGSAVQWYVSATVDSPPRLLAVGEMQVVLRVPDPIWRTVVEATDTWSITASAQTRVITLTGNRRTLPTFRIKPTSTKSGFTTDRQAHRVWRNPSAALGFTDLPIDLTNAALNTAALISDNSNKCQINQVGGIDAVVTTIPYDTVTGTIPSVGMGYVGTEQISWTGKTGTTSGNLTGVTRGIAGTTPATHADNDVIYVSHMQIDGRDIRVWVNGLQVERWLSGINTANTKVWTVLNFNRGISLTLSGAIAGSGAVATINFKQTTANYNTLRGLVRRANKMLAIGTEIFTFTSVDPTNYKVTGCVRAQKGSSMAAHADGDTVYWIEHDIVIGWGDASLSAPTQTDAKKPIIDLDNSTNTSWVYALFQGTTTVDGVITARAGGWTPAKLFPSGLNSGYYTGSHGAYADPATEAGLQIRTEQINGLWRGETARVLWSIYDPAGFITVSLNGDKYRLGTGWPALMGLQKSLDGVNWTNVFNEATPGSASTWTVWTQTSVSLSGTYPHLRFIADGSLASGTQGEAYIEAQAATLVRSSSTVPQLVFASAELATTYELSARITNTTTGDFLDVHFIMALNEQLEIDCENKTVTYLLDNSNALNTLTIPKRLQWLTLESGANTLQYDETGVVALTFYTDYKDRHS